MHNTYLRQLRCRWSLSQDELAELLDVSQGRISRYEKGEEYPTLSIVLALQVIFGRSPRSLVSALYDCRGGGRWTRCGFRATVANKKDYASVKKQHLLSAMMQRATKRSGA